MMSWVGKNPKSLKLKKKQKQKSSIPPKAPKKKSLKPKKRINQRYISRENLLNTPQNQKRLFMP